MLFIIMLIISCCNLTSNSDFIDKIIDDFDRYSSYISIKTEDNTKYIIENDDLFFCLKKQNSLDKSNTKNTLRII